MDDLDDRDEVDRLLDRLAKVLHQGLSTTPEIKELVQALLEKGIATQITLVASPADEEQLVEFDPSVTFDELLTLDDEEFLRRLGISSP